MLLGNAYDTADAQEKIPVAGIDLYFTSMSRSTSFLLS
jgi:hypothetical protein